MTTKVHTQLNTSSVSPADNAPFLRRVLKWNSEFSFLSGLLFLLLPGQIAEFLGITETTILGLMDGATFIAVAGIGIVLFGAYVWFTATRTLLDRRLAMTILAFDLIWVVASAIVLLTGALPLTTAGSWAVLIVADIVTVFAVLEYVGIRRMDR